MTGYDAPRRGNLRVSTVTGGEEERTDGEQAEGGGLGDLVRQLERHAGIIGKSEKRRGTQSTAGKDRGDAAAGELFNRIVAAVCRVEIARAVKGKAFWTAQATIVVSE